MQPKLAPKIWNTFIIDSFEYSKEVDSITSNRFLNQIFHKHE